MTERSSDIAGEGDWVRIRDIVLAPEDRSDRIPPETREKPLEMWVKGFLVDAQARIGDRVTVETATGRRATGLLEDVAPSWDHGFGSHVPELERLGRRLRDRMRRLPEEAFE